jgi:hypothetical protein
MNYYNDNILKCTVITTLSGKCRVSAALKTLKEFNVARTIAAHIKLKSWNSHNWEYL